MPKVQTVSTTPETLKPYEFHGLDLTVQGQEALSDCPFCGTESKFSVKVDTGQWRCFICGGGLEKGGGGPVAFIEALWKASYESTSPDAYAKLAKDRGLEFADTPAQWGLAQSVIDGTWLVPGYGYGYENKGLEFLQLYRYQRIGPRTALLPTPGRKHVLIGLQLVNPSDEQIHICEGPWDGMRWWESLRSTKIDGEGNLSLTGSPDNSLAQGISVVAAATCSAFPQHNFGKTFKGKVVAFLYDNDHPKPHPKTGTLSLPAGYAGMQRDTIKVSPTAADIQYLHWGDGGYTPNLESGYDLRDALSENKYAGIAFIFNSIREAPLEWKAADAVPTGGEVGPKPCGSWRDLLQYWRKALKWTPGLQHGLGSGLASIASTNSVGDQLWLKLIGPPSCGKSTLCEAFSVNKKHCIALSTIRGFHSGFKADGGEGSDSSLIPQIKNRTLITKDGDTLLQSPNLGQILSEARDIYDGNTRSHYRNNMGKSYEGIRTTWLLCGTSSLRAIDSSELGERFLDCVIMEKIDEDLEEEILWRKANQAVNCIGVETTEDGGSHYEPELLEAMERTAGYIDWLKENAGTKLPALRFEEEALRQCVRIGKFVAFMRARPSELQQEEAERELAARLVSQHTRYAACLAFVLQKESVDEEVVAATRQIGLDTARGVVLAITRTIYDAGERGQEIRGIANKTNLEEVQVRKLVRFMTEIGALEMVNSKVRKAWVVTAQMKRLYEQVVGPDNVWEYEVSEFEAP